MAPLAQSFMVLGAVPVEMEGEDRAPSTGETAESPFSEGAISGLCTVGEGERDVSDAGSFREDPLLRKGRESARGVSEMRPAASSRSQGRGAWTARTYENLPAACLVTAATTPPLSLACFAFLEAASVSAGMSQRGDATTRGETGGRSIQRGAERC